MSIAQRNNARICGNGSRPMLFAHGFGCDQNMWRYMVPAFAPTHRIVLFDHVGAGHSDVSAYDRQKYGTLEGYATDVLELCDELELSDVVFVGHSVSAMIGVLAANRQPGRFGALVLVAPSPRYINDEGYEGGFSRQDIDGLLNRSTATISDGRGRWRRPSWATSTGRSSAASSPTAFAEPIRPLPASSRA